MDRICPTITPGYRATGRFVVKSRDDGSNYEEEVVEPISLEEMRSARKAALADRRWAAETGGITMPDGSVIATDDRSKTLLNGKYRTAEKFPERLHRWKGADGYEVTLTSAQVIAIGDAVSDHVQACFDRELDLIAEIDAAETVADILEFDVNNRWSQSGN